MTKKFCLSFLVNKKHSPWRTHSYDINTYRFVTKLFVSSHGAAKLRRKKHSTSPEDDASMIPLETGNEPWLYQINNERFRLMFE